ncbi:MAG: OsmC family protein [Anaerolineae bacterium]|nr:OsmC family protein [Anaerolineae bacterium]
MTRAVVSLEEGLQAKIDVRQFTFLADEPLDAGGTDLGPKPVEIMLSSLGACAVITAKLYAQRKGWDLQKMEVAMEMERVDPASYPEQSGNASYLYVIRKNYTFHGELTDDQKTRLMEIAGKCPVARILQNPVVFEDVLLSATEA